MSGTNIDKYSVDEHIHRYALWTSARAASRSLLKNSEVAQLLIATNFQEALQLLKQHKITEQLFDNWHRGQCERLKEAFEHFHNPLHKKKKRMSHGIAAKIINIYIKTAEILPTKGTSALSLHAHPPVDSILLKKINKEFPQYKLEVNWSLFEQEDYGNVINVLRQITGNRPFWTIEYHWKTPIQRSEPKHQQTGDL